MEKLNEIISKNLVLLRKKNNYKQTDVAEKLNYSYKTVSKWETGEIIPSVENLMALCKLYNVTLDEITSELPENIECTKNKSIERRNKLIISLLSISAVWVISTIVFVYAKIIFNYNAWISFVWGVPVSCVIGIIFNSLWGPRKLNFILISILIWSLLTCIFLQLIKYNFVSIYFVGIPGQIAVLLWSGLKKEKKINENNKA